MLGEIQIEVMFMSKKLKILLRNRVLTTADIFDGVIWQPKSNTHFFIDPFPKRHGLVHNGRFAKFKVLYCSLNKVTSTEFL